MLKEVVQAEIKWELTPSGWNEDLSEIVDIKEYFSS